MMEQLNIRLEGKLLREMDEVIEREKEFSSRSDFVRHAVRRQLIDERKKAMDEVIKDFTRVLKGRGMTPEKATLLTREERDRIAEEFARAKGFK